MRNPNRRTRNLNLTRNTDPLRPTNRHAAFTSGKMSGKAAYEAVKRFMTDNGHDWPSAGFLSGSREPVRHWPTRLPASPRATTTALVLTLMAQNQRLQVGIRNAPPSEFKDYSGPAKRMITKAGVTAADVTVQLEADAAQRVLEKLNNRDEANISVSFRQPTMRNLQ